MRINLLTPGFTTSNGSAFLFPFVVHRRALKEAQFDIRFVNRSSPDITDCDVLGIDSKEFRSGWGGESKTETLELISSYSSRTNSLVWFDTTDSSGTLQAQAIPLVDKYLKSQLLADKSRYTSQIYGGRLFSEYYRDTAGIEDEVSGALDEPISTDDANKLDVSWNSGLSDYSTYGPWKIALYERIGLPLLLRHPSAIQPPHIDRSNDLSARFGATYSRATVRYQREAIRKLLVDRLDTQKLNRRGYMKELQSSKVVLSPLGRDNPERL